MWHMKENYKKAFARERNIEVDFGPVMRFSMMRNRSDISSYVFVEGSSDKEFYGKTNINVLSDGAYYFFRTASDNTEDKKYSGKESVYYSLKRILTNENLKKIIDKCTFIVDRDYSRQQNSKYVNLRIKDYSYINYTKGHSMEDYFIDSSNLVVIMNSYDLDIEKFYGFFDDFNTEMSRYYSYKAMLTEYYNSGAKINYKRKYLDSELLLFDFGAKNYWPGKSKVREECQRMERALNAYPYLKSQAALLQKEIASNRMMVRGHDALRFLAQYIEQMKGSQMVFDPSYLMKYVNQFKVDFLKRSDFK